MEAFIKLTSSLTNPALTVDKKLKLICETTAEVISGADRVSLWTFEDDYSKIVSSVNYDNIDRIYSRVAELRRKDFAEYFDAIINNEVIMASDARTDPITTCFTELYFKPNNIFSLLDFILHHDFKPIGVICCESVGRKYQWSDNDVQSLRRIASASSLYFHLDEK
jgi:GAF domain-containing protein